MDKDALAAMQVRLHLLMGKTRKLAEAAQQVAHEVEDLYGELMEARSAMEDLDRGDVGRFKRGTRLTEAGVRAVNAAFASGSTVTDVARQFGISPSAAHSRRNIWLAEQATNQAAADRASLEASNRAERQSRRRAATKPTSS